MLHQRTSATPHPLRSYWFQKSHLEYLHDVLNSPELDELPESLKGLTLDHLLRNKDHVVLGQENGHLSNLEFNDPNFFMRIRKELTLEMACMFWPTK